MSDGPSDANALGEQAWNLENKAYDLLVAIRAVGRRGWTFDIEEVVNEVLKGSGYKLVKEKK